MSAFYDVINGNAKMNVSTNLEIENAFLNVDSIFVLKDEEKNIFEPLEFKEPKGIYTISPNAVYAGRSYKFGLRINNFDLSGKDDKYSLSTPQGRLTHTPYLDVSSGLIIVGVKFDYSTIPDLDVYSLIPSLWEEAALYFYINDQLVTMEDKSVLKIPLAFNANYTVPSGEVFYQSNKAFMLVQPDEDIFLDITSGAGGGSGVNLVKGENQSGENGGDATLCYVQPETDEVKPIIFIEGGYGGRLSSHAYQEFKDRQCKMKVFNDNHITDFTFVEVIEKGHLQPSRVITESTGADAHVLLDGTSAGKGGHGGNKDDIGYRGEGGISGGRAVVQIQHRSNIYGTPGPLIVLHPKIMVNAHGIIKDKDLKIKKTKIPMLGGKGGESLTDSGQDGQDGKLIVSI